jgi:bacterioferritin-associated ferredoxin
MAKSEPVELQFCPLTIAIATNSQYKDCDSSGEASMYICICNAIKECDLRAAARSQCGGVDAVYAALGKLPQCGQCLDDAAHILIEERALASKPVRQPA